MSSKIRIYPPRKLKTPYLHYDYTVVYYEVNGDTRKRSYFADLKSANEFYVECKRKLKSQANALAGQSTLIWIFFRIKASEIYDVKLTSASANLIPCLLQH